MNKKLPGLFVLIIFIMGCAKTNEVPVSTLQSQPLTLPAPLTSTIIASSNTSVTNTAIPVSSITSTVPPSPTQLLNPVTSAGTAAATQPLKIINTPTPASTLFPVPYKLNIIAPGPMSKVISPIDFFVQIDPDFTGTTRIELIGEDGRELFRKVMKTYPNVGYFTKVELKIDFEIRLAAEIGKLQISTYDQNGRMQAFNSVRLLLQSVGDNIINKVVNEQERILLRFPKKGNEYTSGNLPVEGEIIPSSDLPILFEVLDENGKVIGSRIVQLDSSSGTYQPFVTSINFHVSRKTMGWLAIHQPDDRMDGLAYYYSRAIVLLP